MNNNSRNELIERLYSLSANGRLNDLKSFLSVSNLDVNASNPKGWTALMFAARNGQSGTVKYLLEAGADSNKSNTIGQTAYDIASFWSHKDVMTVLDQTYSTNEPSERINFFTVKHLDRLSEKRKDKKWLGECQNDSLTKFLLFIRNFPIVKFNERSGVLPTFTNAEIKEFLQMESTVTVFLGKLTDTGDNLFACNLDAALKESVLKKFEEKNIMLLERIRDAFILKSDDAAIAGLAHSILEWHSRSKHCECCGRITSLADAGYKRICNNQACITVKEVKNSSYPRLDPSVICAVISSDRSKILLARGRKFIDNMWSCPAGFMEPGESIEDACRREVYEETGIEIGKVTYHSTQPWPFPTQLMIGTVAYAKSDDILIDKHELDDARWFSRSEVVAMLSRKHPKGLFVPPHQALAHHLIKEFLHITSKL